jgi:hypothetical protein
LHDKHYLPFVDEAAKEKFAQGWGPSINRIKVDAPFISGLLLFGLREHPLFTLDTPLLRKIRSRKKGA